MYTCKLFCACDCLWSIWIGYLLPTRLLAFRGTLDIIKNWSFCLETAAKLTGRLKMQVASSWYSDLQRYFIFKAGVVQNLILYLRSGYVSKSCLFPHPLYFDLILISLFLLDISPDEQQDVFSSFMQWYSNQDELNLEGPWHSRSREIC